MNLKPAFDLIKEFEGYVDHAYKDSVGVTTIGYGTTVYPNGQKVKMGDKCTKAKALEYMMHDLETIRIPALKKYIKVACTGNEICALISFTYNVGIGAFAKSTLLKKLNANKDDKEVATEFMKWTKAGGKVLKGLVRRRKAEQALFLTREPVNLRA